MQTYDLAIPILPSRCLRDTLAFYKPLGFEGAIIGGDYGTLKRGAVELHFFSHPAVVASESFAGCYIRVLEVDSLYQAFAQAKLPPKGIPRMDALEVKPWGMQEFAVVDADGNLLRIGQVL